MTQAGGTGATVTARATSYGYDADGNQTTVQDARGYTTTTTYNADDQATLVTDPDGNATLTCYDGDGNVSPDRPAGRRGRRTASPPRPARILPVRVRSTTAGLRRHHRHLSTLSAKDRQTTTRRPPGQTGYETTTYTYDGDGNLVETTAPPDQQPAAPNQVTATPTTPTASSPPQTTGYGTSAASTISYCYDPNGDQTAVVAPATATPPAPPRARPRRRGWSAQPRYPTQAAYQTTYSYDSAGELVSTTTPATTAAPQRRDHHCHLRPGRQQAHQHRPQRRHHDHWTYTPPDLKPQRSATPGPPPTRSATPTTPTASGPR